MNDGKNNNNNTNTDKTIMLSNLKPFKLFNNVKN